MGRGPQEIVSNAVWQDATLLITTSYRYANPRDGTPSTSDVRQAFTLESPGSLVVVSTRSALPGGSSTTSRQTYRKN